MQWTEEPWVTHLKQDRTQNKHHHKGINTFPSFPFLMAATDLFPFLGLRVDLWLSHTYEVNLNSVLLWRRQSAPLPHSHGHTALPSAPALALLYSCLLEAVLTRWNITGQWQSANAGITWCGQHCTEDGWVISMVTSSWICCYSVYLLTDIY